MSTMQRVTLSLPPDLLGQVREMSEGNLSQFISKVLREYLEQEERRQLREALIAGYIENAEEALAIAEEFRYADWEAIKLYAPPYTPIPGNHN
jgi:metal-responsive CopG/Arc/MetJ family transcriptional regulator